MVSIHMPSRKSTATGRSDTVPIAAVMSFLKETRGLLTWTLKDLQKSLLITALQAHDVVTALELQGYVKPSEDDPHEWVTTLNGEAVSGSKNPRFARENVEKALNSLRERIHNSNNDSSSPYTVTEAVAFGDFLEARAQVQAADVGIRLVARQSKSGGKESVRKREFLKRFRARDVKMNLLPYETWMSGRSHRSLLSGPVRKSRSRSSGL